MDTLDKKSKSKPILETIGHVKVVLHIPIEDYVNIQNWFRLNLNRYLVEKESLELINQQIGQISNHQ